MRIDTLKIQNFRGIAEAEYNLHPHVTVLLGNNAKGKSATLDALAISAGSYFFDDRLTIKDSDIRQELRIQPDGSVQRIHHTPCYLEAKGEVHGKDIKWIPSSRERASGGGIFGRLGSILEKNFTNEISDIAVEKYNILTQGNNIVRPFIGYYSVARLGIQEKENINEKNELPDLLTGYKNALTGRNTSQWVAERWFAGLQSRAYGGLDEAKAIFEMAKSKILSLFQSVEPPLKDIRHDPEIDELFVLFENAEGFIPSSFLSSGYKSVLSMGLDIVYRMYILNPHLGAKAFDKTNGITLIDEIDMHLHPKWQGHIIDDLRKAFPLLQFVVATHSAFVLQSLRDARIIDLDNDRERKIGNHVKKSIPEVAKEYMGMEDLERSPYFMKQVEAAEEYFGLLKSEYSDPQKLAEAKKKLDKYEIQYERDPAFIGLLRVERKVAGME